MERMVEKKTESLTREELLEACDILRSIQKECGRLPIPPMG